MSQKKKNKNKTVSSHRWRENLLVISNSDALRQCIRGTGREQQHKGPSQLTGSAANILVPDPTEQPAPTATQRFCRTYASVVRRVFGRMQRNQQHIRQVFIMFWLISV